MKAEMRVIKESPPLFKLLVFCKYKLEKKSPYLLVGVTNSLLPYNYNKLFNCILQVLFFKYY